MQIVLNMPKELIDLCRDDKVTTVKMLAGYIRNGTVLPEHGRLIDADALPIYEKKTYEQVVYKDDIDNAPTILEATITD